MVAITECFKEYHICVKRMSNRMDKDESVGSIDSIKLEHMFQEEQKDQISMATNTTNNTKHQYVSNMD